MKKTLAIALVAGISTVAVAQPSTIHDFGAVNGSADFTTSIGAAEVQWLSVVLGGGATYLDLTTSIGASNIDTEIGLYDAGGNLVGTDDDDGIGLLSTLSFGTGSGLELGDPWNLGGDGFANGEDGPLPGPGTYYIAIGAFNTTFGSTAFDVTSTSSAVGDITVTVFSNVPAPASAALLGFGALAATRRRRA